MNKLLVTLLFASSLIASEGKWTPQQVLELDPQWLKAQGLELPPQRLWDAQRGTGLLAAAISTGGCSGGWISPEGLFVTNHHCLFGVLQEHATPQNDIIINGFLARSRDAELRSRTVRITMPRRFTDVTSQVLAAIRRTQTTRSASPPSSGSRTRSWPRASSSRPRGAASRRTTAACSTCCRR
jgi:Peptidase S46